MNKFSAVTVAAAQYGVEFLGNWWTYEHKLDRMISEAARQGARILVFPEYGCLELASLFPADVYKSLHLQLDAVQACLPDFVRLHRDLAEQYSVYIVASSFPVQLSDG